MGIVETKAENYRAGVIEEENTGIDVGILTKGKPTLGMVLTSLLLQEAVTVRIHVVDTSSRPVINRDDVRFALRLAGDRGILCNYDFAGESDRAFSAGRARLIRALRGEHLCLMDDDVVMPSAALKNLIATAQRSGVYGYISPLCKNSPGTDSSVGNRPQYSPGSLIYQDPLVREILVEYYETSIDVLDRRKSDHKVWENAFLTALFDALDRPCIRQQDIVTYHLDYQEDPYWIEEERTVVARSRQTARSLVEGTHDHLNYSLHPTSTSDDFHVRSSSKSWVRRARRALRLER